MPAQETYLSWSFDSVCILLQTVVCNLSPLFCVCSFEPCQLVDERICDGSDHGVPPVCQVLCEPLTFYKYSLFQTCEVGDCHHFTEEAVELRGQGAWLWSHRDQLLLQHFVIPGSQWLLHMSWYLATCSHLCSAHLSWLHRSCSGVYWKEQPYIRHAVLRAEQVRRSRGQSTILQEDVVWQKKPRTKPRVSGLGCRLHPLGRMDVRAGRVVQACWVSHGHGIRTYCARTHRQ